MHFAGSACVTGRALAFSGVFSTVGVSAPVTSSTRTCVGAGTARFNITVEQGDLEYSKNGAAFADITEGLTVAFVTGDTLAVRDRTIPASSTSTFTLKNNATNATLETITIERTL